MYIIKIVRKESNIKNIYSCEDFNILGAELLIYRYGSMANSIHLMPHDSVFIMDGKGNTLDKFSVTPIPA